MPTRLSDFEGRWRVSRVIGDAEANGRGHFKGEAVFEPVENGLRYEETGVLRLDGQPGLTATRRYLWKADGAGVAVFFEDGRPFHHFEFKQHAEATHWCDPDHYTVRYDFTSWPEWTARWAVKGPRKDYVMISAYRSATA